MTLRRQSFGLWSVLAGLVLVGCAGRGGSPSGQTGNGSSTGGAGSSGGGTGGGAPTIPTLLPTSVRRLTNAEYDASVQALLGTSQTPSTSFPPDSRQSGRYTGHFTLNDAQRVDSVMAKALDDAAKALVTEARGNGKLAGLSPCSNSASMGAACATTFITSFGAKVYRRSLSADEVSSLMTLYTAGATGGTYNDGIDLVTRGLLQSAGFLYITQIGDGGNGSPTTPIPLTQPELSSALAYLVTGAPPDQPLLDLAATNGLGSPDAREAQVRRLVKTPAGKARMVRVIREWLGIDAIGATGKDATVYSTFAGARASMEAESVAFVNEVANNSTGTLAELLGASWSIVDNTLGSVYGVTSAGSTAHTNLPKRIGVLNQGAFLSVYAHAGESGPVLRGVAVMRRVACMNMPNPMDLNIVVVPPLPDLSKSTRARYDVHATDAACANCHSTIDSIGFAFEAFDGMGTARPTANGQLVDKDNGNPGVTTSASTTITGTPLLTVDFPGAYADSNALATALASSPMVAECLARQMFFSSSGRSSDTVHLAEQSFVDDWNQLPAANRGNFTEVLVAYVRSPLFDQRSPQ